MGNLAIGDKVLIRTSQLGETAINKEGTIDYIGTLALVNMKYYRVIDSDGESWVRIKEEIRKVNNE